ncbi:MAG: hypothetical protein Aurels2KO_47970 [Aureliella sp.]
MSDPARPPILLATLSILVIVGCVVLISLGIAILVTSWDPGAVVAGFAMLPAPIVLAIQQYRGTFLQVRSAAQVSSVLLLLGGICSLLPVAAMAEILWAGGKLPWLGLLLPMIVASVLGFTMHSCNRRWARRIRQLQGTARKLAARDFLAAALACGAVVMLSCFCIQTATPQYAEHVTVDEAPFGLPPAATDVSFCQLYRGTIAYEFSIDEASFRRWVASGIGSIESNTSSTRVEAITVPVPITRYSALSAELDGPDRVTVAEGLHYSWSFEDRGVYAVFDSTQKRAYYYAHFH